MSNSADLTLLLERAGAGDRGALDAVFPLVYAELRRLATRQLRGEAAMHTLSPTGLVHETWLRLAGPGSARWQDRAHFYAVATLAMRQILVDHARRHRAARRGGGAVRVSLEELDSLAVDERAELLLALDEALGHLAALDARQAQVVACRFFGGLTEEETAEALGVGLRTVKRDWSKARAWLWLHLQETPVQ